MDEKIFDLLNKIIKDQEYMLKLIEEIYHNSDLQASHTHEARNKIKNQMENFKTILMNNPDIKNNKTIFDFLEGFMPNS